MFAWLIFPFIMLPAGWGGIRKKTRVIGVVWTFVLVCAILASIAPLMPERPATAPNGEGYDVRLVFPSDRYPETAGHIRDAIAQGESPICTINRDGADANRKISLNHIPTKKGYDRDEWPMAMCAEGGEGADIRYVTPGDNRGAGSWIGNELDRYADGTKVLIVIEDGRGSTPGIAEPGADATREAAPIQDYNQAESAELAQEADAGSASAAGATIGEDSVQPHVEYRNCTAAREAGAAPLHKGDPGYSSKLDRDGDGVACE